MKWLRQRTLCLRWRQRRLTLAGLVFGLTCAVLAEAGGPPVTNSPAEESNATLTLANRRICVFRATLDGYSPEERAAAAEARLDSVLAKTKSMLVSTQAVPAGIQLSLDGKPLFVLTRGDVSNLQGESVELTAANAAAALRDALQAMHSLSNPRQVLAAVGMALFGFGLFAALAWAARLAKWWLLVHSIRLAAAKTETVGSRQLRAAALRSLMAVLRAVLNFSYYLFLAFLVYALLWYELRQFPYSRPWGDYLRSHCLAAFASFGNSLLDALPSLAVVVLIVLAARMLVQVLSRVFLAVEHGRIQARRLDPTTAATTRRILVFFIWIIAMVVAYPYIPGSQTLAFKGVTVFIGLVISLGSTNIVQQIASGLLLIYSRAFRAGDYVRVEESEGTVMGIGLCATHICTIKNEDVYIANSVLLGTSTKNYSRLAEAKGLLLPVKVTISYSTPWRQVHAMLLEAARRTPGLASESKPFVLQAVLSDFYVEYELNARLEQPERRVWVQSDLNAN
ncbi:MAG TPA: mechanosensitive ion channel domain-containing protein, partial [Bacillota bacterium]|nr:mechanosensitive ion channel domain-containing protein [Bacillota bacterium]